MIRCGSSDNSFTLYNLLEKVIKENALEFLQNQKGKSPQSEDIIGHIGQLFDKAIEQINSYAKELDQAEIIKEGRLQSSREKLIEEISSRIKNYDHVLHDEKRRKEQLVELVFRGILQGVCQEMSIQIMDFLPSSYSLHEKQEILNLLSGFLGDNLRLEIALQSINENDLCERINKFTCENVNNLGEYFIDLSKEMLFLAACYFRGMFCEKRVSNENISSFSGNLVSEYCLRALVLRAEFLKDEERRSKKGINSDIEILKLEILKHDFLTFLTKDKEKNLSLFRKFITANDAVAAKIGSKQPPQRTTRSKRIRLQPTRKDSANEETIESKIKELENQKEQKIDKINKIEKEIKELRNERNSVYKIKTPIIKKQKINLLNNKNRVLNEEKNKLKQEKRAIEEEIIKLRNQMRGIT